MESCQYLKYAKDFFPHFMSFYDSDPFSPTQGLGDRYFWGWKLKDFNNGILQGGVYSLSLYWKLGYFQHHEDPLEIIKGIFFSVRTIQHRNGSVDEAFPYEYAFSVSSTLAFDLLQCYRCIEERLSPDEREQCLKIIESLIHFISQNVETHGFISNHLATAATAIEIYNHVTKANLPEGKTILNDILKNQSEDGFYLEYESADPGYQTLCTYYLAELYRLNKDPDLLESLNRSVDFLSYFIHPDGSIGGEYGSRNTELYYPGGFEILREYVPLAGVIADTMYESVQNSRTVTLASIDTGNFIPLLENYLVAHYERKRKKDAVEQPQLPYTLKQVNRTFDEAGIIVRGNQHYYSILNVYKGGVFKIFDKHRRELIWDDCGYMAQTSKGAFISTQCYVKIPYSVTGDQVSYETHFFQSLREVVTPFKFFILRFLNLTFMKNLWIGNTVKGVMIRLLITKKKRYNIRLHRDITFRADQIEIRDNLSKDGRSVLLWLCGGGKFSTIHMASSKYFQVQYLHRQKPDLIDISQFATSKELLIDKTLSFKGVEGHDSEIKTILQ